MVSFLLLLLTLLPRPSLSFRQQTASLPSSHLRYSCAEVTIRDSAAWLRSHRKTGFGTCAPATAASAATRLQMCQLMGMNCADLTDFTFSFRGFAMRGGATDVHSHGWGLCFYEGRGLRAFHDPDPASESLLAEFLQRNPVKTLNMVSFI